MRGALGISLTRRRLLLIGSAAVAFLSSTMRPAITRGASDDFVIVNGWVLKPDDLQRR